MILLEAIFDWLLCFVIPGAIGYFFGMTYAFYMLAGFGLWALIRIGNHLR